MNKLFKSWVIWFLTGTGASSTLEHYGIPIRISGKKYYTTEVPQADGTFGSSIEYLFWKTPSGVSHKHYISGGQIVHVSNAPLRLGKVIISLEDEAAEINEYGRSAPEARCGGGPRVL